MKEGRSFRTAFNAIEDPRTEERLQQLDQMEEQLASWTNFQLTQFVIVATNILGKRAAGLMANPKE